MKRQPPLFEKDVISIHNAVFRIVDVHGFRSDAIEFQDVEVSAGLEVFDGRCSDIVTAEIKAWNAFSPGCFRKTIRWDGFMAVLNFCLCYN
ncbi:MAG: hypothetical protein WD097_03890 [Balneolales bacterium]